MNPQRGYYSVVQFCPDLDRFEAANIGVVLFCPESGFLKALISQNNSRIIKFFGSEGQDWKQINAIKKGLQDRLEKEHPSMRTVDDFRQFVATRANAIQLTTPLPMKVFDHETDLAKLYERLLGKSVATSSRKKLRKTVAEKFSAAGLQKKIVSDVRIEVPIRGREIEIPFGFQNGRFNLINPVQFTSGNPDRSFRTASPYAIEGKSIYDHPDPRRGEMQLVVLGQFRANDDKSRELVRHALHENHVKLYAMEELPDLIDEIRRTGKDVASAES